MSLRRLLIPYHGSQTLRKMTHLAAFLSTLDCGWGVFGDWNCTPQQLQASPWPGLTGGEIVTASNAAWTCSRSPQRIIDFGMVSRKAKDLLDALTAHDMGREHRAGHILAYVGGCGMMSR